MKDCNIERYKIYCCIILNQKLAFHYLKSGVLVLSLDLSQFFLQHKQPLYWKFSDDLERLVVLDTDRVLWVLNVNEYTSVKENTVKIEHESVDKLQGGGEFVSYSASKMGDEAWREKLHFLFNKYHQGRSSNQWHTAEKTATKISITTATKHKSKKHRISGFLKEKEGADPEDSYIESKMVLPALDTTSCHVTDLMFYHSVVSIRWKMRDEVLLMICNYKSGTILQERSVLVPITYSFFLFFFFHFDRTKGLED